MVAFWCGCLLLLATTAHAGNSYATISVTGTPLTNGSAPATLVLTSSSIFSTFGNVTTIRGTPTFQFSMASTFVEGCDPFSRPAGVGRPWIAIIQRGTCTYFAKAVNAAQSGASGVIIVDNVRSNTPVLMYSSLTEPKAATAIVSVSLTYSAALRILQFMDQNTNVTMTIAPGDDVPTETTQQPSVSFMFLNNLIVGVVAIGAFSFCVMFGFYMRSRNRRFVPTQDPARLAHMREAREVLLRLPTRSFISLNGHALDDNESPACAVCLENFKDGDLLRTLPCRHEMHQACIDPWLTDHSTCPLCKRDICDNPVPDATATAAVVSPNDSTVVEIPAGTLVTDIALNPLARPPTPRGVTPHAIIIVGPAEEEPMSPNTLVVAPNAAVAGSHSAPNSTQPSESILVVEDVNSPDSLATRAPDAPPTHLPPLLPLLTAASSSESHSHVDGQARGRTLTPLVGSHSQMEAPVICDRQVSSC